MDSDDDCLIIGHVLRRDDVQGPRPTPAQHKAAGVRLILGVHLKVFPAVKGVAHVLDSHASLEHSLHGMDSEDELGHSTHLTLIGLIWAKAAYCSRAMLG